MLPAVAYTLADFLSSGLPSVNTDSIRFEHPSFVSSCYPSLNLYFDDIRLRPSQRFPTSRLATERTPLTWFSASYLLTVQENTHLGRQRLLNAILHHCQQHSHLSNQQLAPAIRGYGRLPLQAIPIDPTAWERLSMPQQSGLCLTLTIPLEAIRSALPIMA